MSTVLLGATMAGCRERVHRLPSAPIAPLSYEQKLTVSQYIRSAHTRLYAHTKSGLVSVPYTNMPNSYALRWRSTPSLPPELAKAEFDWPSDPWVDTKGASLSISSNLIGHWVRADRYIPDDPVIDRHEVEEFALLPHGVLKGWVGAHYTLWYDADSTWFCVIAGNEPSDECTILSGVQVVRIPTVGRVLTAAATSESTLVVYIDIQGKGYSQQEN